MKHTNAELQLFIKMAIDLKQQYDATIEFYCIHDIYYMSACFDEETLCEWLERDELMARICLNNNVFFQFNFTWPALNQLYELEIELRRHKYKTLTSRNLYWKKG